MFADISDTCQQELRCYKMDALLNKTLTSETLGFGIQHMFADISDTCQKEPRCYKMGAQLSKTPTSETLGSGIPHIPLVILTSRGR